MFKIFSDLTDSSAVKIDDDDIQLINYKKYSPLYYYDGKTIPGLRSAIYRNLPACSLTVSDIDEDGYELIRKDSSQLTALALSFDHKISNNIDTFTQIDVSRSSLDDVDYCKRLLAMAHDAAELVSANACHVDTYYRYQAGKVGIILKAMVKHHRLGNWKEVFNKYFDKEISYETINIWMNVASIPNVERWLFLGVWKLNKIRSAFKALEIESHDPILDFSERCCLQLTDEITEKQIKRLVEREKFKDTLAENSVDLADELVDDMAEIKTIQLNDDLAKKLILAKDSDGDPKKVASKVLANKSNNKTVSKSPSLPEQIAFDNQVGPLLDSINLMLKTPPVDIKLDFKRLDELIVSLDDLNRHLSRNMYEKAA